MAQFNKDELDRQTAELKAERKKQKKHESDLKKAERRNEKAQRKLGKQNARKLLRDNGYSGHVILFNKTPCEVVFEEQEVYVDYNLLPAQKNLLPANNKKPKTSKCKGGCKNCKGCR